MEALRRTTKILFSPKYLLYTNTAVSGLMLGLGDCIVQNIEIKLAEKAKVVAAELKTAEAQGNSQASCDVVVRKDVGGPLVYDYQRTGRMFIMGTIMGPFNHVFYTALDKFFVGTAVSTVAKKVVLDETVGAPFFAFSFFMGTGLLEGNTIGESFKEFRQKFFKVWVADMTVWPPAQIINFYFLPPRFRVAYVAMVTLGWNTFLSYMKHSS